MSDAAHPTASYTSHHAPTPAARVARTHQRENHEKESMPAMTVTMAPICVACKYFHGWKQGEFGGTCDAYPVSIPHAILMNQTDHRKAAPGDNGISFAPKTKQDANYPDIVFSGSQGSAPPISASFSAPAEDEEE